MKSTQTLEIVLQISCQSLKKGHREGKNIPPGQIPLYGVCRFNRKIFRGRFLMHSEEGQ